MRKLLMFLLLLVSVTCHAQFTNTNETTVSLFALLNEVEIPFSFDFNDTQLRQNDVDTFKIKTLNHKIICAEIIVTEITGTMVDWFNNETKYKMTARDRYVINTRIQNICDFLTNEIGLDIELIHVVVNKEKKKFGFPPPQSTQIVKILML